MNDSKQQIVVIITIMKHQQCNLHCCDPLAKEFSLLLKGKYFREKFLLAATAFFFNCLKEKSVYKVTKDFPLTSMADSHNSVVQA